MNAITTVRAELRTWADKQPYHIRAQAAVIGRNLSKLNRTPGDEVLQAQTKDNIARLEKAVRSIKTAEGTKQ